MSEREGPKLLCAWLKGRTQLDVAESLGVAQQTVSAWKRGTLIPSALQRVRIQLLTGISANAWDAETITRAEQKVLGEMVKATDRRRPPVTHRASAGSRS